MPLVTRLVYIRNNRVVGSLARAALFCLGVSIPATVKIGCDLELPHGAPGLVVHDATVIGSGVKLYQGVTIGRSDTYLPRELTADGGRIEIGDNVVIGAGAVVLYRSGRTVTVGEDAVIGANSVVLKSVPPGEIWAGNPAQKVSVRQLARIVTPPTAP